MNDVMISRNAGALSGYLNEDAMNRLINALNVAKDYESVAEPYKTWLTNKSAIFEKDMSKSAILAELQRKERQVDTVSGKAL